MLIEQCGKVINHALEAAEDECKCWFFVLEKMNQQAAFVPRVDGEVQLIDEAYGERAGSDDDLLWIAEILTSEFVDLWGDGGGDEDGLMLVLDAFEHIANIIAEADIEHAVNFIQDDEAKVVEVDHAAVEHVDHAPGCAHNDLIAIWPGEFTRLGFDGLAAEEANGLDRRVLAQFLNLASDLDGQLARGGEDERLEGHIFFKAVKEGKAKGGSFAGAGFGLADDIFACENRWHEHGLGFGGANKAALSDALENRTAKAQRLEGACLVENFTLAVRGVDGSRGIVGLVFSLVRSGLDVAVLVEQVGYGGKVVG